MKSKQEVIQEAWLEFMTESDYKNLKIDDNGFCNYQCRRYINSSRWDELYSRVKSGGKTGRDIIYRPKSLSGIETNNGWQETGYHHWRGVKLEKTPFKNGEYYEIGFMSATDNSFHNQGIKQFNNGFLDEGNYPLKPFPTHFKPISKSDNPLY